MPRSPADSYSRPTSKSQLSCWEPATRFSVGPAPDSTLTTNPDTRIFMSLWHARSASVPSASSNAAPNSTYRAQSLSRKARFRRVDSQWRDRARRTERTPILALFHAASRLAEALRRGSSILGYPKQTMGYGRTNPCLSMQEPVLFRGANVPRPCRHLDLIPAALNRQLSEIDIGRGDRKPLRGNIPRLSSRSSSSP
jgi:hypothetical protein